jgi:hypothetical protein
MNSVVAWYEISNQPPFSALLYRDSRIQKIILTHVRPCSSLFFIGVGGGDYGPGHILTMDVSSSWWLGYIPPAFPLMLSPASGDGLVLLG